MPYTMCERFVMGFDRVNMASKSWLRVITKPDRTNVIFFIYLLPYSWDRNDHNEKAWERTENYFKEYPDSTLTDYVNWDGIYHEYANEEY